MRQPSLIRASLLLAAGMLSASATALAQPPRHGPPPEATAACQGLSESQACTVTFQDQQLPGTCRTGPGPGRPPSQQQQQQQSLACVPEHMPPPPGGARR